MQLFLPELLLKVVLLHLCRANFIKQAIIGVTNINGENQSSGDKKGDQNKAKPWVHLRTLVCWNFQFHSGFYKILITEIV